MTNTIQKLEAESNRALTYELARQYDIQRNLQEKIDSMVSAHKVFAKSGADQSLKIEGLEAEVARLNALVSGDINFNDWWKEYIINTGLTDFHCIIARDAWFHIPSHKGVSK